MEEAAAPAGASSPPPPSSIDPRSGFCPTTKTFHSLRPPVPLPPASHPLSVTSYVFSLLSFSPSSPPSNPAFVDASRGDASLSYPELLSQVRTLASSLRRRLGLRRGDVAFVLSPFCLQVPVLYFALLSVGAVVLPSNPSSTPEEISRRFQLGGPSVAFTMSREANKLASFRVATVLLDSPLFLSLLHDSPETDSPWGHGTGVVQQADVAAILYTSGTTGLPKAAALTHRSVISTIAAFLGAAKRGGGHHVTLLTATSFTMMGFFSLLKGVALGETTVLVDGTGVPDMLRSAEKHGATQMTAAPLLLRAMSTWEDAAALDLRALECVLCGGTPLSESVARGFKAKFPWMTLAQGYGSTEGGGIAAAMFPQECSRYMSVGRLHGNVEAKIVDLVSGEAVGVGCRGELWVRSPHLMEGYLGDDEANTTTFAPGGWLKTGDLCFFDEDGFLFVVDRLKEIIKYKDNQVSPVELEQLFYTLPEVADAAVIPYPDEEAREIPMACVIRGEGSALTESQVM